MNKKLLLVMILLSICSLANIFADSTPTKSRVYGKPFSAKAVNQSGVMGSYGSVDTTFGNAGALDISSFLADSVANVMATLSDGSFFIGFDNGVDTIKIVKFTSVGTVDTTFASPDGFVGLTSSGFTGLQTMSIDSYGRVVIAGGTNNSDSWMRRIDADGNYVNGYSLPSWGMITAVAHQSTGNLLVAGFDGIFGFIARFLPTGFLDDTFGLSGFISFYDVLSPEGILTISLQNIIVDASNNFYTFNLHGADATVKKFNENGALVTGFNETGSYVAESFNNYTAETMKIAFHQSGDLILAASNGTNILLQAINATSAANSGTFASLTIAAGGDTIVLRDLITTTDGNLFILYDNQTNPSACVVAVGSNGQIDTSFANSGTLTLTPSSSTDTIIYRGAIEAQGQLYFILSAEVSDVTSYVYRVYTHLVPSTHEFLEQVEQQQNSFEQGTLDETFGDNRTYPGVVFPYGGNYGASLQQKIKSIIELSSGKFLVAMDGYLDDSNSSNIILSRLNNDGTVDTDYADNGFMALPTHGYADLYATGLLEQNATNSVVVTGHADETDSIVYLLDADGEELNFAYDVDAQKALGVLVQGTHRILVFHDVDGSYGKITAYTPTLNAVDTTFGDDGYITHESLYDEGNDLSPLENMGPLYGHAVDSQGNILIAYKNVITGYVDVAKLAPDGNSFIADFGNGGIVTDVFDGVIPNSMYDTKLALDNAGYINVATVFSTTTDTLSVRQLFAANGTLNSSFGIVNVLLDGDVALNHLGVLNDNSIIMTGYVEVESEFYMVTTRVVTDSETLAGTLDTDFNPQGDTPGIAYFQVGHIRSDYYARNALGVTVETETGNMVIAGYEQATASTSNPLVMKIFGKPDTYLKKQYPATRNNTLAGTVDSSFGLGNDDLNDDGSKDLTSLFGAGVAKVVYAYPAGSAYQGYLLIGIDNGSEIKIARVHEAGTLPDLTFGTSGIVTITTTAQLQCLMVDLNSRIVVGCSNGVDVSDIYFFDENGAEINSLDVTEIGVTTISDIKQQKSGRFICCATDDSGSALIFALQDNGDQIDETFNPLIEGAYIFQIGSSHLSLAIYEDDTIFVGYTDAADSNYVKMLKLRANGTSEMNFGSGGVVNLGVISTDSSSIHVACDNLERVVLASVSNSSGEISLAPYDIYTGVRDVTFASNTVLVVNGLGTGVVLSSMMINTDNKIMLFGYNASGANGRLFGACVDEDGVLESTWNIHETDDDAAGINTFTIGGATELHGSAIYFNGMIYLVGGNTASYSDVPLLMRMFGYDYVVALEQQPFEFASGFVDSTIDRITPGLDALNLEDYLGFEFLEDATVQKMYIYPDGSMLLGFTKGTSTYIVKMLADFTIDDNFNNEDGYIGLANRNFLVDILVNNGENGDNSIFVLTKWWDTPVLTKYNEYGDSDSNFVFYNSYNLVDVVAVKISSNQRILLAGENQDGDYIVCAYDIYGQADLSYANGDGYYTVSSAIQDLVIGELDEQFVSYISGTDVRIDRIFPNGSGLIDNLWENGYLTQSCTAPINSKLAFDDGRSNIVLAVQDGDTAGNSLKVFRYSLESGAGTGSELSITYPGIVLILVNVFTDEDANIYVVGYDQTNDKVVTARIQSINNTTIALDTSYAAGTISPEIEGVAHFTAGDLQVVTGGAYHPDRRVYFIGNSTDDVSFIGRIFGDIYTEQILSVQNMPVIGDLDETFDSFEGSPDGLINLRSLSAPFYSVLGNGTARAIAFNADGSALIACSVGSDLIVAKVNADFQPDTDFGTAGLTTPYIMQYVSDIKVNDNGEFFVSGIHNGAQSVAHFYASGTLNNILPTTVNSYVATKTLRQKSGRYLVAGKKDVTGIISAYQSVSPFILDTTFGPALLDGYYATGVDIQIDDFVIDSYDRICLVYRNPSDNHVYVEKIMANGAGKDSDFASGLAVDTNIVADTQAFISIDDNDNILVAGASGQSFAFIMLNGADGTTTIDSLTPGIQEVDYPFLLTDMTVSHHGNSTESYYYLSGFNLDSDNLFVMRVPSFDSNLGLIDTNFGYDGFVDHDIDQLTGVTAAAIKPDGKLVAVGVVDGVSPAAMCIYLDPYRPLYEQGQIIQDAGIVDQTLSPMNGDLNLHELLPSLNLITNDYDSTNDYVASKIYTYADNDKILLLLVAENAVLITRLHKDFTLDTSFNSIGYYELSGLPDLSPRHSVLHVDDLGNIFVAGGITDSFVLALDADGNDLSGWTTPTDNLITGTYAAVRQSSYALICAGQNTYGALLSYTTDGELDPEFGNGTPGIFTTAISSPIEAIALEQDSDALFIAINDGGSLLLQKIFAHGSDVDSSFEVQEPIENLNGNGIKVVTTTTDCVVVAAVTDDGLVVASYNIADGSTFAEQVIYDEDIYASDFYLTDMYTTNNGQVVVTGYDEDYSNLFVARLTNQYIKDDSFGYEGQFLDDIGVMEYVYGARIYNDNRILCVGKGSNDEPYMARLFGDVYQDVFEQTGVLGVPGTVDTTYHADSQTPGYLNLSALQAQSENTVAFGIQANAIVRDANGKYLVTGKNSDNRSILARYLSDGSLDTDFGIDGYVVDQLYDGGEGFAIALDSSGNIFVAGQVLGEGYAAYIAKFTSAGVLDTTFTNSYGSEGYTFNFSAECFYDIAIDSNGKLVTVGTGYGNSGLIISRYLPSGAMDTSTFQSAEFTYGYLIDTNASEGKALALDSSDNIYVVGKTSGNSGYIAKYLSTGLLDTTGFNASGIVGDNSDPGTIVESGALELNDIILDNYGKVLVVGSGNSYGFIARYSSAGAVDTTFNTVGSLYNTTSSTLFAVAVGQDVDNYEDYIFVSGGTAMNPEGFVQRYTDAGVLDLDFIADGSYGCYDLVLNATDNPVVTGTTSDELNVFTALYADNGDLTTLFGTEGFVLFDESTVVAVIAEEDGIHYLAFNDLDNETSFVVRLNNADEFDTTYSVNGISETTRRGANFMMVDGQGRIVLAGNDDNPWITRYQTDGSIDFEIVDEDMDAINVVREQTLSRLILVGSNDDEYAAVRAYTDQGVLDVTFNSLGQTPGEYQFDGNNNLIYSLVIDEYDRLIIPVLNSVSGDVDLYRLTSNGELDTSFGDADGDVFTGYIASALTDVYQDESSIHVTLDETGNIVVVAIGLDGSDANGILLASFDNGTATIAQGGNGAPVNLYDGGLLYTSLTEHTITDIVSIENGEVLVAGYRTSDNDMWVASLTSSGEQDEDFNPEGSIPGLLEFAVSQDAQDQRLVQGIAIRYDGRISVVLYETASGVSVSYLGRIYNDPFEEGLQEAPNSEEIGLYNTGFGLDFNDSISFYATSDTDDDAGQVAQAVTLQGNNRILVALDGQNSADTSSRVFVSQFTIDGLLDVELNETGQLQVPHEYENEYVRAAHAFMSPDGIHKILLAGYAQNTTLGVLTSWLMQYDLDNLTVDSSFGGFDNDATGTASGDLQELYTIALQSSGNIIASGLYFDDSGAIASYTSSGKLDTTFGSDGIYFHNDAQDGIFSHVIDSKNRVVFGYVDSENVVVLARLLADGSGLDISLTDEIIDISDSEDLRVAVNSDDELYCAAVSDDTVYIVHYGELGGLMAGSSVAIPDTETLTIARLIVDVDGNVTIFASDENQTNGDDYIIIQLNADLTLNTGFNGQGYLKYRVNQSANVRQARDGVLHDDGRFIAVGSEEIVGN